MTRQTRCRIVAEYMSSVAYGLAVGYFYLVRGFYIAAAVALTIALIYIIGRRHHYYIGKTRFFGIATVSLCVALWGREYVCSITVLVINLLILFSLLLQAWADERDKKEAAQGKREQDCRYNPPDSGKRGGVEGTVKTP